MPEFYTCVILLINLLEEIGEKQRLIFGSRGGQFSPLMHVALSVCSIQQTFGKKKSFCGFSMGRNQYWAGRVYDL